MADVLSPVPIRDLRWHGEKGRRWLFDQNIPPLETLTSVRGKLLVIHHATTLEVRGEAETIVTLCCDRCLQPFNHRLTFSTTEHIWLTVDTTGWSSGSGDQPGDPPAADPNDDGLDLHLDPSGSFDPGQWIYEQLSLQWPLVNRCGPHCPGPDYPRDDIPGAAARPSVDPRWAGLAALREVKEP